MTRTTDAAVSTTATLPLLPDDPAVGRWDRALAPFMFTVGFVYLLVVAGLIHRAAEPGGATPIELRVMNVALVVLWPVVVAEALVAFARRAPGVSPVKAVARVLLVVAIPPMRLAWVNPATDRVWLPRLGWRRPGKQLLKVLDRVFGGPMLVFAFLILPVLGLEYVQAEKAKAIPGFKLVVDVSVAVIWVAFAMEFIVKVSASPHTLTYLKERWLDLAIVGLPTLEYVLTHWVEWAPLARLLRLTRAVGPQQLGQMGRVYRLRGLVMKGWHAVMLFEVAARLTGNSAAKRLRKVEARIADLEEQLADLRAEADALRRQVEPGGTSGAADTYLVAGADAKGPANHPSPP